MNLSISSALIVIYKKTPGREGDMRSETGVRDVGLGYDSANSLSRLAREEEETPTLHQNHGKIKLANKNIKKRTQKMTAWVKNTLSRAFLPGAINKNVIPCGRFRFGRLLQRQSSLTY